MMSTIQIGSGTKVHFVLVQLSLSVSYLRSIRINGINRIHRVHRTIA